MNASDAAGNHSALNVAYTVAFDVCLLYDTGRAAKSGSTLPIKIQLCDANHVNRSAPGIVVNATGIRKVSDATTSAVLDAGQANPDLNFRYDATLGGSGGYIFNLKTLGLSTGTYELTFGVTGDPTAHEVRFAVK